MRCGPGDLADSVGVGRGDLMQRRLHGQQHVGAGVAIGHGENVERVDDIVVRVEPTQAGVEQLAKRSAIERVNRRTG